MRNALFAAVRNHVNLPVPQYTIPRVVSIRNDGWTI